MDVNAYFKSFNDYFWQWEEGGEVIAIPNGNTIAYKKYIIEVLQDFSVQGFPPFGTLLALIIATNPNGVSSLNTVYAILKEELDEQNMGFLNDAIVFLKLLAEVPQTYKAGNRRVYLLQSLFNDFQHRILSPKNSQKIFEIFSSHTFHPGQMLIKHPFQLGAFYKDFRVLSLLAGNFKTVEDILATLTSLPELPEELDLITEPQEEEDKKDLIEQLIEDDKTFRVGSLIKRIWSGLNIPVHSTLPSQQPLGGVSDLTNKGTFDKLLISEFANDDLIFMSRVANNEALYIHREIPPVSNNLQRIILVDVSLKNWGTPKIMAYAIALAITRHPKTDIACTAFAFGNSFYPLFLDTVDDVVDSLQLLENGLHGAQGLEAFFKEYPNNNNREVFLITAASTLNQTGMLKVLNDYFSAISYWIHTDAEGNIDLYKKQQKSKKHIQHIQLPLNELWTREAKTPKEDKRKISDYPILFKDLPNPKKILSTYNGEIFQLTRENTLLRYVGPANSLWAKGWQLVYEGIPYTDGEVEIGRFENGDYVLLIYEYQQKELMLLNISTNAQYKVPFPEWDKGKFVYFQHKFYYLDNTGGWSFSLRALQIGAHAGETKLIKASVVKVRYEELMNKGIVKGREEALKSLEIYANVRVASPLQRFIGVYINEKKHLVFNIHELSFVISNHIKLSVTKYNTGNRTEAQRTHETTFTFHDGSTVETVRTGMIILRSSNTRIPTIYVPSTLDTNLGVATHDEFAGNAYFHKEYKEPRYFINIKDPGPNKLQIVKILQQQAGIDLKMAKEIIDTPPAHAFVTISYPINEVIKLRKALEIQGAKVTIKPDNIWDEKFPVANKVITLQAFFEKYIDAFILNILDYGTKH